MSSKAARAAVVLRPIAVVIRRRVFTEDDAHPRVVLPPRVVVAEKVGAGRSQGEGCTAPLRRPCPHPTVAPVDDVAGTSLHSVRKILRAIRV